MNNEEGLIEKIFAKRVYRFLLFIVSYLLAVLIATSIFTDGRNDLIQIMYGLILFPTGLGWFFISIDLFMDYPWLALGWISYFIVTLYAGFIQNQRTSKILFVIFVIFLILNIIGCAHTEPPCC